MKPGPLVAVLAAFTIIAITATVVLAIEFTREDEPTTSGVNDVRPAGPAVAPPANTEPEPAAPPAADVSLARSSCEDDFPVVFQPQMDGTTRLVAEGRVVNRGDLAGRVTVTAEWLYFGGGSATASKTVDVAPGQRLRVPLSRTVPQSEGLRMVGHQPGDQLCQIRVTTP